MLYTPAAKAVIGLFCVPVFIIGVIGNFVVMWLVVSQEHMKTPTNIFIVQLAISDLIILFFCMPFTVTSVYMTENWVFGKAMCKTVMFMQVFSVLLSILTLTAMSIERYYKLVHPFKTYANWTIASAVKICLVIVAVAAALSVPRPVLGGMLNLVNGMPWDPRIPPDNGPDTRGPGFHVAPAPLDNVTRLPSSLSRNQEAAEVTTPPGSASVPSYQPVPFLFCFEDLGPQPRHLFVTVYNSVRIVLFFVLPLLINAYIYWTIGKALHKSNDAFSNLGADEVNRRRKTTRGMMRMLRLMVVIFAICWLPYQAFLTIQALDDRELFRQEWFQKGMIVVSIFMYLHCISNPILYYRMNSDFRRGFRRYLCCKAPQIPQRQDTSSTKVPITPPVEPSNPNKAADSPMCVEQNTTV